MPRRVAPLSSVRLRAAPHTLTTAGPTFITFRMPPERVRGNRIVPSADTQRVLCSAGTFLVEFQLNVNPRSGSTQLGNAYLHVRANGSLILQNSMALPVGIGVTPRIATMVQLAAPANLEFLAGVSGGDGNVNPTTVGDDGSVSYMTVTEMEISP